MARFLKIILSLVLLATLWGCMSDTFAAKVAEESCIASQPVVDEEGGFPQADAWQGYYITTPRSPYVADAELASAGGHIQLLTSSRAQRLYTTEYILSLKGILEQRAQCEGALSLHRSKLFDSSAIYCCSPVSEYYVFALRRIII